MAMILKDNIGDTPFRPEELESSNWKLTDVDRMLLKQTDEEYEPHDWEELKSIVGKPFIHS